MATEFSWSRAGESIYAKDWNVANPKAVVALIHGQGEHINRYDHVAEVFTNQNIAVVGFDHIGHGQSTGLKGHASSYEAYLEQVTGLLEACAQRYPNLPVIMYGHSMGGSFVLNYILDKKPNVKLAIVTSPWIQLAFKPSAFMVGLGKLMKNIYPKLTQPTGLNVNHISSDAKEVDKYKNDPLVHGKVSAAAGLDLMEAGDKLHTYEGHFPVPLLMFHGSEDQITSHSATEAFAKRVSGDITFNSVEGQYHEVHNDTKRAELFSKMNDWLAKHL